MLPPARARFPYAQRSAVVKECGNGRRADGGKLRRSQHSSGDWEARAARWQGKSTVRCQPVDAQRGRSVRFDRPKCVDVICVLLLLSLSSPLFVSIRLVSSLFASVRLISSRLALLRSFFIFSFIHGINCKKYKWRKMDNIFRSWKDDCFFDS